MENKTIKITDDILLSNGFTYNEDSNFVISLLSDEYDLTLEKDNKHEEFTGRYFVYIKQNVNYADENDSYIAIPSIEYVYQLDNLIQLLEGDFDFKIKLCND